MDEQELELINARAELDEEIKAKHEERRAKQIEELESKRQSLIGELRELEQKNTKLDGQSFMLNRGVESADRRLQTALNNLKELKQNPPRAAYALPAEMEAYNQEVADAQAEFDEAQAAKFKMNVRASQWNNAKAGLALEAHELNQAIERTFMDIQILQGTATEVLHDPKTGLGLNGFARCDNNGIPIKDEPTPNGKYFPVLKKL